MNRFKTHLSAWLLCAVAFQVQALDFGRIPQDEISVYVQELGSGKVLEQHRADVAMNPASTMKLVTAFSAFQALGQDYRWKTEFKSNGKIHDNTLEGDLYWVGSGNPVFDQKDLVAMQQQLRDKGIHTISGNLVLDRSVWPSVGSADDFESDSGESFMTPPDPNMLAYKVVWLKPQRDELGNLTITSNPPLPEIPLENKAVMSQSAVACKSLKSYMTARFSDGILYIGGKIPESCLGEEMFVNMLSAREFAVKSFINQWRAAGGEISDGYREAVATKDMAVLASNQSMPLSLVLTEMNKHSNNLIARSVFLKLGEHGINSANAVKRELAVASIDHEALVLENGAGLSRRERVTAKLLAQLLERAYYSPFKQAFIQTLPIAGTDGTLKSRLKTVGGNLRMKTGTLNNVRALAGYWLGDKPMVVVVLINSPQAMAYLADLDKLVTQIVQAHAVADGIAN